MRVVDIHDSQGRVFSFDLDNTGLSRKKVCNIISGIPDVIMISGLKPLKDDQFCEFELAGKRFVAWELWGDYPEFWIGPKDAQWCGQFEIIREAFISYKRYYITWSGVVKE